MKHHHSHTALFVIACSTIVVVFATYGYMHHRINVSLSRAIEGKRTAVEKSLSAQMQGNVAALYVESAADRVKLREFFVPEDSTIAFIESVEKLGSSSGSDVQLSGIEAIASGDSASGRLRVRVEARGSWASVLKTVMLAESLPYGVSISDVRVDAAQSSTGKGAPGWKATFVIEALMTRSASGSSQ